MRFAHLYTSVVRPTTVPSFLYSDKGRQLVCSEFTRTTVCYEKQDSSVVFGAAFLAPQDKFNRKIGRDIAYGRMLKKPFSFNVSKDATDREVLDQIISTLNSSLCQHVPGHPDTWLIEDHSVHGWDCVGNFTIGTY